MPTSPSLQSSSVKATYERELWEWRELFIKAVSSDGQRHAAMGVQNSDDGRKSANQHQTT